MTNLQIAKIYLATNAGTTATALDAAITSGAALTAINALSNTALLNGAYQAAFGRDADAEGLAFWGAHLTAGTVTTTTIADVLLVGAASYVTAGDATIAALNTTDKVVVANKATADAAATGITAGNAAIIVKSVTSDVATVATAATATATVAETANVAAYDAALVTYTAAVATALASKTAADTAALSTSSVTAATASKTAATTAKTDADAVVAAAAVLTTTSALTPSIIDDAVATTNTATAATAATAAATVLATATTALTTATAAADAAALVGTTTALTTGADTVFGTAKSDTITATSATYGTNDIIVDSSAIDSDTLTVTASDDITLTPTIVGVENVNFNLDAASTPSATTTVFNIDATNIAAGTLTAAVTKSATTVTSASVTGVKTGMTIATALPTLTVATANDADISVSMTAATATTLANVNSTADDVTIAAAGNFTLTNSLADGSTTINGEGSVTVTDMNAVLTTNNALTVNAKGAITLTDTDNAGNVSLTTTTGNINAALTNHAARTGTENFTASTSAGNATITHGGNIDGALTMTASGNIANTAATDDGDITVTAANAATSAVLTATGGITVTSMTANKALTMTYGQASTIATAGADAVTTLTLASNNAAASAADAKVTTTASLIIVDNINFTGSNNATLSVSGADLVSAAASTAGSTTAAAVIATDTSSATSRIELNLASGANLDLSKLAVDQIAMAADQANITHVLTLASGADFRIANSQANLALTAAAVAGNSVTVTVEDDSAAGDTTAYALTNLTTTNIATVNLVLSDAEAAVAATGTYNVGTANNLVVTGAGALTIGTSVVAKNFDASAATGVMTVEMLNTAAATIVKTGTGNDVFHITNNTAANYNIDAGAGVDTIVTDTAGALDLSASTISLANIEKFDITAAGNSVTLSGVQATGKSYVIIGDGATDVFAVLGTNATGETIDVSGVVTSGGSTMTLTGLGGGDVLTGSAISATTISGGTGNDTITGGAAIDTITAGTGVDTINITDTNFNSDVIITTVGAAYTAASADTVNGFTLGAAATGGDNLDIADADVIASGTTTLDLVLLDDSASTATGAAVVTNVTGAYDLDNVTTDTSLLSISGTFATAEALETALETGGTRALTFSTNGMTAKDSFLAAYSDGTNAYVAIVETGTIADNAKAAAGTLDVINVIKLAGITDVSSFNAANLDVI